MPSRFADLQIHKVAVHEVLVRDHDLQPVPPRCSDSLAVLDPEGLGAIRERIVKAMGSDSKSIQMDIKDDGPTSAFHYCGKLLEADDNNFLEISKTIAQKLAGAQSSRSIPGGVLVVLRGTIGLDARKFAGVIKAEVHSGFLKETAETGPLIRYLSNLLLTPQQKLHKIGLFVRESPDGDIGEDLFPDDFSAYVFDSQMNGSEITTAANYFYERFLGCAAASSSRKMTRDFYNHSRKFIEAATLDDEAKVECVTALTVYLRSNQPTIHVTEFAQTYLPQELHQDYADFFTEKEFPDIAIQKDITTIKRQLRRRKLNFTTDVRITAPAERFNELVAVQGSEDGATIVRILGNVADQH